MTPVHAMSGADVTPSGECRRSAAEGERRPDWVWGGASCRVGASYLASASISRASSTSSSVMPPASCVTSSTRTVL